MTDEPDSPKRTVVIRPQDMPGTPPPSAPPSVQAIAPAAFEPPPPPPAAPPRFGEAGALVGTVLNDNYEVTRYITRGGMGEIYEGRQIRGNAKVAIKVILPQFAADPEFYKLLEREADLLASLGHDAIVKFRGLSQDPRSQVDYLTLEFVPGPSLEDQMDMGPIDPAACRGLLRRLAAGLDTAHEKGIYHRDLSPDNILLREGRIERATIIDFGIAKDADTSKKTIVGAGFGGKLGFAAPEAFGLFGREIGPWTDIYSLALVVAAANRGKVIDMGTATPIDAIQARQSVPALDGVEPWLATVLARMLAPDPADRLRSMADVIAAVDALPPVGTPFEGAPEPAAAPQFVRAADPFGTVTPATAPPTEGNDVRFVRAETITPIEAAPAKSKLPLIIGGGIALVAAIGAGIAFMGGDPSPAPETAVTEQVAPAAPTTAAPPVAAPMPADWSAARTAIAAVPCSDIRAVAPERGSTSLSLTGWMAAGGRVPATAGGYRLDSSAVKSITPAPAAETCAIIGRLKNAAGDAGERGSLNLAAETSWQFGQLKKAGGYLQVPNGMAAADKPLFIVNIEDGQSDPAKRVASGQVPAGTSAFPTDSLQPVRNLQFFLSAPKLPATGAETGTGTGVAAACTSGCTSASGWVILQ